MCKLASLFRESKLGHRAAGPLASGVGTGVAKVWINNLSERNEADA